MSARKYLVVLLLALIAFVYTYSAKAQATVSGQQTILTASDGADGDEFGDSVALSADGNTVLVGAPGGKRGQGVVYVFTFSGGTWTQQAELTATDGTVDDRFGLAVALSTDGRTALVSASFKTVNGNIHQGAAYIFTLSGGQWTQQAELPAGNGAKEDYFGYAGALSGDGNTAILGVPLRPGSPGMAYVFTTTSGKWAQQATLTASDGTVMDEFGYALALSANGGTALIGAQNLTVGGNRGQGAAYVFTTTDGKWTQQAEISADDGTAGINFGGAVALSGDGSTALISANGDTKVALGDKQYGGAAYTFTANSGKWVQQTKLTAGDSAGGDFFGRSVALSSNGGTALIGASSKAVNGNLQQGAAYLFAFSGGKWLQQAEPIASDGDRGNHFGYSVALSGNGSTSLIGAGGKNSRRGAVYIFSSQQLDPAAFEMTSAKLYRSDDRLIEIQVPSGWQTTSNPPSGGAYSYAFTYGGTGTQDALLTLQIQIFDAQTFYQQADPSGKANSPASVLQILIDQNSASQSGGTTLSFGKVQPVKIGTLDGQEVTVTIPASSQGPAANYAFRIAQVPPDKVVYVVERADPAFWDKGHAIMDKMLDSLVINAHNIPTPTATLTLQPIQTQSSALTPSVSPTGTPAP